MRLENTATRDGESDRQIIIMALVILACERPGWLQTCRDLATGRFESLDLFNSLLEIYERNRTISRLHL